MAQLWASLFNALQKYVRLQIRASGSGRMGGGTCGMPSGHGGIESSAPTTSAMRRRSRNTSGHLSGLARRRRGGMGHDVAWRGETYRNTPVYQASQIVKLINRIYSTKTEDGEEEEEMGHGQVVGESTKRLVQRIFRLWQCG